MCAEHQLLGGLLLAGPGLAVQLPVNATAAMIAVIVTLYYWWQNVKGIEASSKRAVDVMKITTLMVVIMMGWGIFSIIYKGAHLPPMPSPLQFQFLGGSFGFLRHTSLAGDFRTVRHSDGLWPYRFWR